MDPKRAFWNQQQQALRQALARPDEHPKAIDLFLSQHAMVHSAVMSQSGLWSFEDEVWQDLTEETIRCIPRNEEHSIAWLFWHVSRIEDITMNMLLAGCPQLFAEHHCLEQMKIADRETGNAMDGETIANLSAAVDILALKAYRIAVGQRTRELVQQLQPTEFKKRIDPSRLQSVMEEGAVVPAAYGLIEYWGGLTIAGLLLMPPTRHNFVHLNEALRLKQKVK